jgi:hypothetical protein
MRIRRFVLLFAAILMAFAAQSSPTMAQVKPGDFITPENATKVQDLLPPGAYKRVLNGMTLRVTPTERIDWPPPYKDATEKYSAQVRMAPNHRSMIGYVAGQPFPLLDPNDPDIATKIMWNNTFRPISTDDYDLRFFDCDSVYWGRDKPFREIAEFEVGHYAGYNLVGRTEVEPLPVDPDFKISNRFYVNGLYPVLAPAEARGVGLIKYRYADPNRGDDQWTYLPTSRRLRRLNESIMDTAAGAQAYHPNDYEGFSGKNENYNWKFLGEKTMLACIDTDAVPDRRCPTDGGASHCPDPFQMRQLYIIEGTPRQDRFTGSLYSKDLLYIDAEADFVMYHDQFDRKGELFINYTSWMTFKDRAAPDARIAIYPFKREFQVGSSSANVQSGFSTVCYHPSIATAERDCWYINMGAIDKDFCTTQAMVKAGH